MWPLQPFSQDYGLAALTIHFVCVNFIREWRDQNSVLRKFFMAGLVTLKVLVRNLLIGNLLMLDPRYKPGLCV